MASTGFLSSLNLMTLLIVLAVAVIVLTLFLGKRANRHSMDGRQERNVAEDIDSGKRPPEHSPPT